MTKSRPKTLTRRRPAEVTTFFAGLAVVLAYFLGVTEPGAVAGLAAAVGGVPAVVTWLVDLKRDDSGQVGNAYAITVAILILVVLIALRVFGVV